MVARAQSEKSEWLAGCIEDMEQFRIDHRAVAGSRSWEFVDGRMISPSTMAMSDLVKLGWVERDGYGYRPR